MIISAINKEKEYIYIYILNIISCFSVVLLHANTSFWQYSDNPEWAFSNIIESVFYFAVPCFLMISGATLIDFTDKYSLRTYFIKRINKTVIPFIIWSFIGLFYSIITRRIDVMTLNVISIIDGILNAKYIGIYHFFINLFIVYLAIPLFSSVEKKMRKRVFLYLIILGLIINSAIPFLIDVLNLDIEWEFCVLPSFGYIIFPLIGYYIHSYWINRKARILIYLFGVGGLLTHLLGTFYASRAIGAIDTTFKGYTNLPCVLYSAAVFLVIRYFDCSRVNSIIKKVLTFISKETYGVYLTHIYFLELFSYLLKIESQVIGIQFVLLIITIPPCILISYFCKKWKLTKWILP